MVLARVLVHLKQERGYEYKIIAVHIDYANRFHYKLSTIISFQTKDVDCKYTSLG